MECLEEFGLFRFQIRVVSNDRSQSARLQVLDGNDPQLYLSICQMHRPNIIFCFLFI